MCMMCAGARPDELMKLLADNIRKNTVTYVPVMGGGFAYSVGMTGLGMPELYADFQSGFALELPHPQAEVMLARAVEDVVEVMLTEQFTPSILSKLTDPRGPAPFDICFQRKSTDDLVMARKFYEGFPGCDQRVRALRLVRRARGATALPVQVYGPVEVRPRPGAGRRALGPARMHLGVGNLLPVRDVVLGVAASGAEDDQVHVHGVGQGRDVA